MSVTYQQSSNGGTLAVITANEGTIASIGMSSPASFTFDVPDGDWVSTGVQVTAQSAVDPPFIFYQTGYGSFADLYFVDVNAATSIAGGPTQSIAAAPQSQTAGPFVFTVFSDSLNTGNTATSNGYGVLSYLQAGTTATTTLQIAPPPSSGNGNRADTALTHVTAVLTLQSILPTMPAGTLTAAATSGMDASGSSVLPYTGAASFTLSAPTGNETTNQQGNGFAPFTYLWAVTDPNGAPADTLTGQGTSQITFSFATADGYTGSLYDEITVHCQVTNSLYPHQVGSPLSAGFSAQVTYHSFVNTPVTAVAAWSLNEDAHRRPIAATSNHSAPVGLVGISGSVATSINGLFSKDAGHTYYINFISDIANSSYTNFGADNPSLIVDYRSNHFRVLYSKTISGVPTLLLATGLLDDRFSQSAHSPAALTTIAGSFPAAAQHPTDQDYVLLVYSDTANGNALKSACSLDAGATWMPLGTVLPALDLTKPGRPALCWVGNTAVLVYSSGNALMAMVSQDRGKNWTAITTPVSTYTPNAAFGYYCLSMVSSGGQVYLLAFAGDTQHSQQTQSPRLFVSGDLGKNWKLRAAETVTGGSVVAEYPSAPAGVLPALQPPSGIGASPFSGILWLDTRYVSQDCGLSWKTP